MTVMHMLMSGDKGFGRRQAGHQPLTTSTVGLHLCHATQVVLTCLVNAGINSIGVEKVCPLQRPPSG